MINNNEFVDRYYPAANATRKDDVLRFLDNLNELIGDTPVKDALKNKSILCRVFYLQKSGNISRPHYQKIKEYLLNLFDYTGVEGIVPSREDVIAAQNAVCYFRSINALLAFIDSVGEHRIENYNPTTDLVRVKAVCVLGWIGLSPVEISNLKRKDLTPIGLDGYQINTSKGTFEIYGEPFTTLYYLTDLEEYNSLPVGGSRGRKIFIKSTSDYLFRSQDENCEKLIEKQIINIINRFNMGSDSNTQIVFRNLYKNALFLEIYNDTSDKPLINKIIDIIGCSYNVALSHKEQYLKFAEAMDSNKI